MQILPTITTITPGAWREKLAEVKKFKLKEVCLFLTCLNSGQRKEFYSLLGDTFVRSIPFVHIRSDMTVQELDFLAQKYDTKFFNIHSFREFPLTYNYGNYKKSIYIENNQYSFDEKEIKEFGGTCLDLAHLENDRLLHQDWYQTNVRVLANNPPQCAHISGIKKEAFLDRNAYLKFNTHHLEDLSELDYLKRYPLSYFGSVAAIELENTIEEQLKVEEYLSALIKNKKI